MRDFYNKKDTWYATWPEDVEQRAFVMYVPFSVSLVFPC